ncbi:MAG: HipA domain-containing protein, partial [Bosea sp.]|nr:HipA domain-containing protein [Bosea sp. (in: a-proteobacteria)]
MAKMTIGTGAANRHRFYEDAIAMLLGAMLVSLGVALYAKATLVTGGLAGLALLVEAAGGPSFSAGFFLLNLPFYWLALLRMGRAYTLRTFLAVALVSGLTLLGLDEMMARYASYEDLAALVRKGFDDPEKTLRELFGRIVFSILCGNTDDHARNHSAFWTGSSLQLTPAYDI